MPKTFPRILVTVPISRAFNVYIELFKISIFWLKCKESFNCIVVCWHAGHASTAINELKIHRFSSGVYSSILPLILLNTSLPEKIYCLNLLKVR
jgi:hypothetical protein